MMKKERKKEEMCDVFSNLYEIILAFRFLPISAYFLSSDQSIDQTVCTLFFTYLIELKLSLD